MRLLVCGGRNFDDVPRLWRILDGIAGKHEIECLIEGAQVKRRPDGSLVGADHWAHEWAKARGIPNERFPADWTGNGRSAGPKRNRKMRDEGNPTHAVAMPGGNGTENMVSLLKEAGIPVWEVTG